MDASWLGLAGAIPSAVPVATIIGAWLLTYALHSTVLLLTAWWLASRRRFAASPAARHAIWNVALVAGWITSAMQLASPWRPVGGAWQLPESARRVMAAVQVTQRDDSPARVAMARAVPPSAALPSVGLPSVGLPSAGLPSAGLPSAGLPNAVDGSAGARTPRVSEVRHVRVRSNPGHAATVVMIDDVETAATPGAPSLAALREVADVKLRLTVIALSRTTIAVLAWGGIALALLLRLAYSRHRLLASLRARRDASRTVAGDALRHLVARAGTTRAVRLTMSDALPAPAAISLDEIVVPTRALRELTIAEQEGVLAHELAHVVRGDPRWLRLATWIECIGWFQPLNRVARRQLQLSAEFAADAWAVQLTREPIRLAQALARVAEWLTPRAASPAWHIPGADGSPLVERVRRLTAPLPHEAPRIRRGAHLAMGIAAASALALLPHIDTAPLRSPSQQRLARFELRLADSAYGPTMTRGARTRLRPGVRFLRFGDASVAPNVMRDSGLVVGGARRMLIRTARASS